MKKLLLLLFLAQVCISYGQNITQKEKKTESELTSLEKFYKDPKKEKEISTGTTTSTGATTSKDTTTQTSIINGRVNRKVVPSTTNTYVIEYNFKTGVYTRNKLDLEINTPVVFKITNINRLAYDVKVIPRDSILADTGWENGVLEFLKENSLPTPIEAAQEENKATLSLNSKPSTLEKYDAKDKDDTAATKVAENLNHILYSINSGKDQLDKKILEDTKILQDLETNKPILIAKKAEIQQKIIVLDAKNQQLEHEKKNLEPNEQIEAIQKDKSIKENNIQKESLIEEKQKNQKDLDLIEEKKKSLEADKKALEDVNKRLAEVTSEYKRLESEYIAFNKTFINLKDIYFKILKINECYNNFRLYMSNPLLQFGQFPDQEGKTKELFSSLPLIRNQYQDFLGNYIQLGHEYYILNQNEVFLKLNYGGQSKFLEPAKNMKTLVDNWNEELKKADITALIHEIERAHQLLQDPDIYSFTSKPIQPLKDVVIFDIKIKKHNQDKPDYNNSREFSYKEYTKGGMRFDAGIGFAISYFDNAAQYEIAPNEQNVDVITLKEKNVWVPSFIGMFTAGFRSNKLAAIGISAGLGVSANDGKLQLNNFYFGPSLILGRENRFCLTGGITIKGMTELKKDVEPGTQVPNTNEISSFTNSTYNFGPFFSLTYNLTKGIRNNVKYFKK